MFALRVQAGASQRECCHPIDKDHEEGFPQELFNRKALWDHLIAVARDAWVREYG